MPRPRKYDESVRVDLIVKAAEMIAEGGRDGVALRPLAASCGCTTSTIYSLFGSREGLIDAVVQQAVASFTAGQHAVGTTDDPVADLLGLGRAYRSWALANPALYDVMFTGHVGRRDRPTFSNPSDGSIAPLLDAVGRAVASRVFRTAPVEQMALSIWAGVHGWMTLELIGATPQGPRKSAAAYGAHLDSLVAAWRR